MTAAEKTGPAFLTNRCRANVGTHAQGASATSQSRRSSRSHGT